MVHGVGVPAWNPRTPMLAHERHCRCRAREPVAMFASVSRPHDVTTRPSTDVDSRLRGNDGTCPVRRPLVIPAKAGIHRFRLPSMIHP